MLFHLLQHFYVQQMADIPYLLSDISIPVGNMWVRVFNYLTEWVLQALGGRPPSSPSTCSPPGTTPPTAASSTATWVVTLYYCCVNINVIRVIMCANLATVCWDNQQPIEPVQCHCHCRPATCVMLALFPVVVNTIKCVDIYIHC